MRTAEATQKVRLVCRATGAAHEAWPVDAKELLASGEFVREADYVPAEPEPAAPEPAPVKKGK